ncbi:unnamed protein product [Bursaphelenchus xylophilus]|uniref:(pine wood nematode) hypothetical protein n=1 Tax=Bursaphelenchus xylophilus TaxID=6326 RepID=A0A1I7SBF8_BURXY|nr:unnamed protein product [Bursaphelenchus xylophilus]CAG9122027.1 unnamed protein product [Bursaphelenchus xylophilus]
MGDNSDLHMTRLERLRAKYRIRNPLKRRILSEFAATSFLMYAGFSAGAQTTLSHNTQNAGSLGVSMAWGLSLVFAIQMSYHLSGSHLNPAISFAAWTFGDLPFTDFLLYTAVQTAASFLGAFLTFVMYFDKINEFDGGHRSVSGDTGTAGIFATYPGNHLSLVGSIFDQICCTAMMACTSSIVTDKRNKIPSWAQPSLLGAMLLTICLGFGLNAGNAMNPARDLGPRLFTFLAGYGSEVFSYRDYQWFLVPVVCPFIGAVLGMWGYQLMIGIHIPDDDEEEQTDTGIPDIPSTSASQTEILEHLARARLHSLV